MFELKSFHSETKYYKVDFFYVLWRGLLFIHKIDSGEGSAE